MKRTICIVALMVVLLVSGCSKNEMVTKGNENFKNYTESLMSLAFAESGVYYIENDQLLFYDFKSEKTVYLCTRPNCLHEDDTCDAYVKFGEGLCYSEEGLYLLAESETKDGDEDVILEIGVDGSYRKDICSFGKMERGTTVGSALVENGKYYIEIAEGKGQYEIVEIDLVKGEKNVLYRCPKGYETGNRIVWKGKMYFIEMESDGEKRYICSVDMKTKEVNKQEYAAYSFCILDDKIYASSEKGVYDVSENRLVYECEAGNGLLYTDGQYFYLTEFSVGENVKGTAEIFTIEGKKVDTVILEADNCRCIRGMLGSDNNLYFEVIENAQSEECSGGKRILQFVKSDIGTGKYNFKEIHP